MRIATRRLSDASLTVVFVDNERAPAVAWVKPNISHSP
jgi:hypothetical protein